MEAQEKNISSTLEQAQYFILKILELLSNINSRIPI